VRILLVEFTAFFLALAAPAHAGPIFMGPTTSQTFGFTDQLGGTTMTLAFDGTDYWSSSGGSNSGVRYAQYDSSGVLISTFSPGLDFRSVFTDSAGDVFARTYASRLIFKQSSPGVFAAHVTLATNLLGSQSAVVLDGAGAEYVAHAGGTISRWDLSGASLGTVSLTGYGSLPGEHNYPNNRGVAAGENVWLTYSNTILSAWDSGGNRIDQTTLLGAGTDFDSHFSLSYANGMVFIVDDRGGQWRGYQVFSTCFVIDAIDDQFRVINDGATADFFVLANDECSDDTPISVVELPGDLLPDRGGLATTDGATVGYTPAAGFEGFEEFTYTAQDAGLDGGADPPTVDQDTAWVVVEVLENRIPDAVDDAATTLQDQAIIIDVLGNDALGNAPDVVGIETAPANGSATVQAGNTIRYSPNFDFFGEDSFEYRLTDANGDSDVATVTVGVFFVRGQVPIDIMPSDDGNNLNLRAGQGAGINIAILSVGEFFEAPNEIDPLTLKFGPREGNIWGSPRVRDVDGDGDEDLVVKFLIQQTGIPCGDTHAILFGRTFDFESISGMDTINTFNCPRVRKRH